MFNCPEELRYARTHEWVREEDGLCVIGLTDFAQDALGDIVFVNLPEVGDELKAEQTFADVESVKAVSDLYAPVRGTVMEAYEEVVDNPALINEDPYGAWLVKVENVSGGEDLLDAAGYQEVCKEEA
jgi:glycine cleavage system H protein